MLVQAPRKTPDIPVINQQMARMASSVEGIELFVSTES
jgi:hypothetical protein